MDVKKAEDLLGDSRSVLWMQWSKENKKNIHRNMEG